MASSCFEKPQEEEDHIKDEPYVYVEPPPFDASILTPAQLVTLNELQKKYPGSAKTSLARRIRVELIRDQAELEGRELDELRIEKLARDHIEVCFDKNYLCASVDLEYEFLMLNEPRPLLELADLGDELDVDR
ncbi:hypothetical protein F2Q70_00027723 [Brassica cretica]|uniref:Uncharacterized protein n=1 Tax=Brassica cretica TaxID=69181 RepID=A0A8S9LIJ9_BRACR|nr:hypothetical protein F2Q70_00027723 [Brassica cretica]